MSDYLKTHKSFINSTIIIMLILVLCFLFSFSKFEIIWDDIWCFHFIRGIANGLLPYKDLNIIITPLFHFIGVIFYNFFGNNYFSFDLAGAITNAGIVIFSWLIIRQYTKNKYVQIIIVLLFLSRILTYPSFSYNYLMMIFPLIILFLEKQFQENCKIRSFFIDFFIGILLALMILSKQTIGLVFTFSFFIYYLIHLIKKNPSFSIKGFLVWVLGLAIPLIVFLIYLLSNNIFTDFMNYCFGSIIDFASNNTDTNYFYGPLLMIMIFLLSLAILHISNGYKKKTINTLFIAFSVASLLISYPLFNTFHITLAILIPIIVFTIAICEIYPNYSEDKIRKYEKGIKILARISMVTIMFQYIFIANPRFASQNPVIYENEYSYYNGGSGVLEDDIKIIENVHNYIIEKEKQGYTVLILSSDAAFFEIPYNIWHRDYDLLLNGNLGYKGLDRIIDELSKIEKPLFLKWEFKGTCWQEPQEIEDYIVQNYHHLEDIEGLRVFVSRSEIDVKK